MNDAGRRLRTLADGGALAAARPGTGATAERHALLVGLGRTETVAVARLAEAHLDALAILDEAGRRPVRGALYGVWAAQTPGEPEVALDERSATLGGTKRFCSGIGIVDRALVTVEAADGRRLLVDAAACGHGVEFARSDWVTSALAAARTGTVVFAGGAVDAVVGGPRWYLDRPGFWHGACGPAACWAGAAIGLVDDAAERLRGDDDTRAELGALLVAAWTLRAVLAEAGHQIDAAPHDTIAGRARALAVRHTVERTVVDVLDRYGQACGPRALAFDADVAGRFADTALYVRQHHGPRDLRSLGAEADPAARRVLLGCDPASLPVAGVGFEPLSHG